VLDMPSPTQDAWRRRLLRSLTTVALVMALGVALLLAAEAAFAPWSRSFGLWPTLAGGWVGELTIDNDRTTPVYLELGGGMPSGGSRRRPYINGQARWCDGSGPIRDYEVSGAPDNWRGTQFQLSLRNVIERSSGVSPTGLQGHWAGDEIRGTSELVAHATTVTATVSRAVGRAADSAPRVRYHLRRGDEDDFLAACKATGGVSRRDEQKEE
jgi:hypothetical protein